MRRNGKDTCIVISGGQQASGQGRFGTWVHSIDWKFWIKKGKSLDAQIYFESAHHGKFYMNKVPVELAFVGDLDHLPSPVSKLGSLGLHCYSRKAINKSLTFQECRCLFFSAHFFPCPFFLQYQMCQKAKERNRKEGKPLQGSPAAERQRRASISWGTSPRWVGSKYIMTVSYALYKHV